MSRNIKIVPNEFYHIYNRGVEKRDIFMNNEDRIRFLRCLKEFNNGNNIALRDLTNYIGVGETYGVSVRKRKKEFDPIVDIVCFCLMPNHFHLILRELILGGVSMFMRKLGNGYTGYFNLKYERVGSLFQGVYKAKHINTDEFFKHLVLYIHNNPVELAVPKWKEDGIKNLNRVSEFLNSYRWSSHNEYCGKSVYNNGIINKDLMAEFFEKNSYIVSFNDNLLKNNENEIVLKDILLD